MQDNGHISAIFNMYMYVIRSVMLSVVMSLNINLFVRILNTASCNLLLQEYQVCFSKFKKEFKTTTGHNPPENHTKNKIERQRQTKITIGNRDRCLKFGEKLKRSKGKN